LYWRVGLVFVWVVVYLSGSTTAVVGPKALGAHSRCALPLFVVWSVVACSLLISHCISLAFKVYASTSHTTLEGVLRGRSFCVVVGFLSGAFLCAVFLAGDCMGTARCGAPTR
jgi:hypothetical protein